MSTQETRKRFRVIVDGKVTFKFYSSEMQENMVYKDGAGNEYLCKGNEFIKLTNNSHDTHRNFTQI